MAIARIAHCHLNKRSYYITRMKNAARPMMAMREIHPRRYELSRFRFISMCKRGKSANPVGITLYKVEMWLISFLN
jgi:hypothetical protein